MIKNPVWNFYCISRDDKEQLLLKYYNQMKMGEQIH